MCFYSFVFNHNIDGTYQTNLVACFAQYSTDDVGSSSLTIGTGDTKHTHVFTRVIKEERNYCFHSFTSIRNNKQSYACRDFFRNIFHQSCNCAFFYSHLQKLVTVNSCTFQTNEQATIFNNAGVRSNISNYFFIVT